MNYTSETVMIAMHSKQRFQTIVWAIVLGLLCLPWRLAAQDPPARLGLPKLAIPVDNPLSSAKIALGRKIFLDTRLSHDSATSCASCHQPKRAFTDGLKVAKGTDGRLGTRNTPSLLNAAYNQTQFWDGRRADLESQALDPLFNPREHAIQDVQALLGMLRRDAGYAAAFKTAFRIEPNDINVQHISRALACFTRTLVAGNSPFDRYYFQNEKTAMPASAVRGLVLFQGAARCATCHTIDTSHALFTDNKFHSLSVGLRRIAPRLADITSRLVNSKDNLEKLDQAVLTDEDVAELGRFVVTYNPADIGKFRTPSLRNVAQTAPYMHDGSVPTLEDAVEQELYYRSVESGQPLILTPGEKNDLVEFLRSLNSQ
ncbi:cytochrome-c peroxidase [Rugamonas sp. CCM 8940]|uniref:cytochrome-c peroxidase n=1 Tax=Rugamonas sp. CCM 8940 TaxID=2765359 RepID=UPI0018F6DAB8|nr:cytochrome c peroxidase [Rugamonas sp. CCM 8940]MBJ7313407.1 cytochrome c family protein [Rugamonas sp. CCM 8940]